MQLKAYQVSICGTTNTQNMNQNTHDNQGILRLCKDCLWMFNHIEERTRVEHKMQPLSHANITLCYTTTCFSLTNEA